MTEPARALATAPPARRAGAARPVRHLGAQQPQPARARRADASWGTGSRSRWSDSGEAIEAAVARHRAGADRLPDAQDVHPGQRLDDAPLPDRAPRARRAIAGRRRWTGRSSSGARVGRHGARGRPASSTAATSGRRARSRTREAGKSSLYRHEVRRAAIEAVVEAVTAIAGGRRRPERVDHGDPQVVGRAAAADPPEPTARSTGARDSTATVLRRIRAAEGQPGVLDTIAGEAVPPVRRPPRGRAARRARRDRRAARRRDLPRDRRRRGLDHAPQAPGRVQAARDDRRSAGGSRRPRCPPRCTRPSSPAARSARSPTRSAAGVGYLHFDFYNGAMSTDQCRRLLDAYRYARAARHARDRAAWAAPTSSPTASTST